MLALSKEEEETMRMVTRYRRVTSSRILTSIVLACVLFATLFGTFQQGKHSAHAAGSIMDEFPTTAWSQPNNLVTGPDGNLWFTESHSIGRITPTGSVSEFFTASGAGGPIAVGPDGNLWFADGADVGQITTSGVITDFPVPAGSYPDYPRWLTVGADGNLWFGETGYIGRITTSGIATAFPLASSNNTPLYLVLGADGNLWFYEDNSYVGKVTPSRVVTEYPISGSSGSGEISIAAGADGNIWYAFGIGPSYIGRITPAGVITNFPAQHRLYSVLRGPDGNIWFTESYGNIGRITPSGTITEFPMPHGVWAITPGPDGNIWYVTANTSGYEFIGRITPTGQVSEFQTPYNGCCGGGQIYNITPGPEGNIWFTVVAGVIGRVNLSQITAAGSTWLSPASWFTAQRYKTMTLTVKSDSAAGLPINDVQINALGYGMTSPVTVCDIKAPIKGTDHYTCKWNFQVGGTYIANGPIFFMAIATDTGGNRSSTVVYGSFVLLDMENSTLWGGYGSWSPDGAQTFSFVEGAWTVPGLKSCVAGETSESVVWVGLGGQHSAFLEQAGSQSSCINGIPKYTVWQEMYPQTWVDFTTVKPGDKIIASVQAFVGGGYLMSIRVNGKLYQKVRGGSADPSATDSAECIAEAPMVPFSNYGSVSFSQCYLKTADGTQLPISAGPTVVADALVSADKSHPLESISALKSTATNSSFTATWISAS